MHGKPINYKHARANYKHARVNFSIDKLMIITDQV